MTGSTMSPIGREPLSGAPGKTPPALQSVKGCRGGAHRHSPSTDVRESLFQHRPRPRTRPAQNYALFRSNLDRGFSLECAQFRAIAQNYAKSNFL
ncbi:MAG: hypothetical protein RKK15_09900, partial [Defluviicoccus sp.]|nr:hypothetical protein [Defluviicoccus sp.]